MGTKNYLIEGVSCTGKTSVCSECSGAVTTPFMVTVNWHIREIRKRVRGRIPLLTRITFGM
ncbi:hypothetical protein [Bacillus sp. Marseille-Q1617]|uniref:hypothetical protein n=1 Tax=Bacillus sp. Marseille-Q1617 TaxID=2736887 RepID=UPI001C37885C|nr:hypothetical protein [Bacillus sp. Marseille-Q1617]